MNLEEYRVGWEGVRKAREEREGGDWTPPPPLPPFPDNSGAS